MATDLRVSDLQLRLLQEHLKLFEVINAGDGEEVAP